MKKTILTISLIVLLAGSAWGQWNTKTRIEQGRTTALVTDCSTYIDKGQLCYDTDDLILYVGNGSAAVASGGAVSTDSDCSTYVAIGQLCQDTDDGKLYKGTGAAVEEIASGSALAASDVVGYTADAAPTTDDLVITVNNPASAALRKVTLGNFSAAVATLFGTTTFGAGSAITWTFNASAGTDSTLTFGDNTLAYSGAFSAASMTVSPSADPTMTFSDSDNAAGTAKIYGNSSGGANDIIMYIGVEDSTGESTNYVEIDGVSETIDLLKPVVITGTQFKLPSSDADPTATAGYIRHDSSNTSASGGGLLAWHDGTNIRQVVDTGTTFTKITKYEYLPIRYAEDDDSVTAPAAAAKIGTTGLIARSFAEDADNGVLFFWQIPSDWVSGFKYRVIYAIDTNAANDETVNFALSGCSIGNTDAIACTEGTAVAVSDELTDAYDTGELIITDWSAAVTITDAAVGEMAKLLLIRDVSEDDAAGHTLVVGIEIKYLGKLAPASDY